MPSMPRRYWPSSWRTAPTSRRRSPTAATSSSTSSPTGTTPCWPSRRPASAPTTCSSPTMARSWAGSTCSVSRTAPRYSATGSRSTSPGAAWRPLPSWSCAGWRRRGTGCARSGRPPPTRMSRPRRCWPRPGSSRLGRPTRPTSAVSQAPGISATWPPADPGPAGCSLPCHQLGPIAFRRCTLCSVWPVFRTFCSSRQEVGMPRTGMRRVSLAVATAMLATMSGLSGVGTAHAATSDVSLVTLPDQGENAIYSFVNSATSSIDVTIYELKDTTLENDLVSREKAGANVRVIMDQAQKSYNTAAYNVLTAGGVGVVWSSTSFTYTHQKTITVNNDESYISTGNFDTTYYATSRDFGVFDTDTTDVAAVVAVFNADYAHTSITPSDGDDLVWSPTDSQTQLLNLINGAQHSLDIEQEEFSDTTLVNAIVADENRGVTVRVVIEDPSEYSSELNEITAAGGKVTGYSSSTGFYIHAKTVIADYGYSTAKAFVGSENFSSGSLNDNRELGMITTDSGVVTGLETIFGADFSGSDNNKGSIFSPGTQTTPVGGSVYLQTQGEDTCTGSLSYKATGLPSGLSINSTTGVISGTASKAGTYSVTVTGTDSTGPSGSAAYTWDVGTTSNTVTVTNPGSQTGTVGTAASLQISASDSASGQTLTYSATGLPAGLSINSSTGLISGTPTTAGSNSVAVTVKDTTGATGTADFTWTINSATGNTVTVTNPGARPAPSAPRPACRYRRPTPPPARPSPSARPACPPACPSAPAPD